MTGIIQAVSIATTDTLFRHLSGIKLFHLRISGLFEHCQAQGHITPGGVESTPAPPTPVLCNPVYHVSLSAYYYFYKKYIYFLMVYARACE